MSQAARHLSAAALALCLSFPAWANGPPPSRIESVLDLSTPEAAVRTYSDAFADDDFVAVYFVLDPMAREAFHGAVRLFTLEIVMAPGADPSRLMDAVEEAATEGPFEHAADQDAPMVSGDLFHVFELILLAADRSGLHAVDFAGPVEVQTVSAPVTGGGQTRAIVDATDAAEGPVRFLLQRAPSNRWRVVSVIARPDTPNEAAFLPTAEMR